MEVNPMVEEGGWKLTLWAMVKGWVEVNPMVKRMNGS